MENIYILALNQEAHKQRDYIINSISSKLSDFKEILMAVSIGKQMLIKKKAKYDPEDESLNDRRKNSNRGSQFRGVSRNGKKWQVTHILMIRAFYYKFLYYKSHI